MIRKAKLSNFSKVLIKKKLNNDKYKNVKKRTIFIHLPETGQLRKSRDSGESEIAVKTNQNRVSNCLKAFEEYRIQKRGNRIKERGIWWPTSAIENFDFVFYNYILF